MDKKTRPAHSRIVAGLLKARLYASGVTQAQIAAAAGVTPQLVSYVISGQRRNEKIMHLILEMTYDVNETA